MSFDYSIYPSEDTNQLHLLNHIQINEITDLTMDQFTLIAADSSKLYYYINDFYNKKLVNK